MNYQQKYRNNPVLRRVIESLHTLAIDTLESIGKLFLLFDEKTLKKHKNINGIFTFLAMLYALVTRDEFEKFLDQENPRNKPIDKWVN